MEENYSFLGLRTENGTPTSIFEGDRIHFNRRSKNIFFSRGDSILHFSEGPPYSNIGGISHGQFGNLVAFLHRILGRSGARRVWDNTIDDEIVYEFR